MSHHVYMGKEKSMKNASTVFLWGSEIVCKARPSFVKGVFGPIVIYKEKI